MDFLPKAFVVGVFAALPPAAASSDAINRIWMQLSRRMGYRQLVQGGEGGAQFITSPEDALVITPPLIQFRHPATLGFANAADDAQVCLKTVGEHLGSPELSNLGIKHVAWWPAQQKDARAFVQNQLLPGAGADLPDLARGGDGWVGVKYGIDGPDSARTTLVIEPLMADNSFVFVDLDVQHPGVVDLDRITDRTADSERYLSDTVQPYLERAAPPA